MNETFKRIQALDRQQARAFMAVLTERLLINLHFYAALTELPQAHRTINAMALVWEALQTPKTRIDFLLQEEKLTELEEVLASHADSFGARRAGDALIALATLLESMATEREGGAWEIAQLSRHGIEQLVMAQTDDGLSEHEWQQRIVHHPLMADDEAFQAEALALLESRKATRDVCVQLRRLNDHGVSNLGLSLTAD